MSDKTVMENKYRTRWADMMIYLADKEGWSMKQISLTCGVNIDAVRHAMVKRRQELQKAKHIKQLDARRREWLLTHPSKET